MWGLCFRYLARAVFSISQFSALASCLTPSPSAGESRLLGRSMDHALMLWDVWLLWCPVWDTRPKNENHKGAPNHGLSGSPHVASLSLHHSLCTLFLSHVQGFHLCSVRGQVRSVASLSVPKHKPISICSRAMHPREPVRAAAASC
jgi:hypothetical protein